MLVDDERLPCYNRRHCKIPLITSRIFFLLPRLQQLIHCFDIDFAILCFYNIRSKLLPLKPYLPADESLLEVILRLSS